MDKYALIEDRVEDLFDYCQETGILIWKRRSNSPNPMYEKRWNARNAGKTAGYVNGKGYVMLQIDKVNYLAHRIIWRMVTGSWPLSEIDHINLVRHDNRWSNLREATTVQNGWNKRRRVSKFGLPPGVARNRSKFSAKLWSDGKWKCLGTFETPSEAGEVYIRAAKAQRGEFYRL